MLKKESITEIIRKIVKEELNKQSKIVTVSGDRGRGKFQVQIIKRASEFEYEDEEIYKCKIVEKPQGQPYDYKKGDICYVVKGSGAAQRDKSLFGEIDPFVGNDE